MTQDKAPLTVMTMNLRFGLAQDNDNGWGHRKPMVEEILTKYPADFLGFQEANHFQTKFLIHTLSRYRVLGWHNKAIDHWQSNLIFCHPSWVCRKHRHYFLSDTPDETSRLPGSQWPRQCVIGWFQREQDQILVGVTHFDFESSVQEKSGHLVLSFLSEFPSGLPLVIMGDFNANPGSKAHAFFCSQGFEDVFAREKAPTFHGFTGRDTEDQIDWILFRGGLIPVFHHRIKDSFSGRFPSDHFPVRAGFDWPQRPGRSEKQEESRP